MARAVFAGGRASGRRRPVGDRARVMPDAWSRAARTTHRILLSGTRRLGAWRTERPGWASSRRRGSGRRRAVGARAPVIPTPWSTADPTRHSNLLSGTRRLERLADRAPALSVEPARV